MDQGKGIEAIPYFIFATKIQDIFTKNSNLKISDVIASYRSIYGKNQGKLLEKISLWSSLSKNFEIARINISSYFETSGEQKEFSLPVSELSLTIEQKTKDE